VNPPADSSLLLMYRAQNSRPGMSLQVRVTRPSGPYSVAAVDDVGRGLHRLVPRGTRRRRLSRGGIALRVKNSYANLTIADEELGVSSETSTVMKREAQPSAAA
jgi:hypothetical protein